MKKTCLLMLSATLLLSCSDKSRNDQASDPVTIVSEKDNSPGLYSKRGYGEDMVQLLYNEKLKKSKELSQLDEEMSMARSYQDSTTTFSDYDRKSSGYYSAAETDMKSIKDSLLREKIKSIITSSSDKYTIITTNHRSLLQQLEKNGESIDGLYAAMKVLLTLPDIENYQKKSLPTPRPLQKAVEKQKEVIRKMDSVLLKSGH